MSATSPASKQTWNSQTYDRHARFVSDMAGEVFSWLDPQPGEAILDLGCGDGVLSEKIAAAGAELVGVDASESFITAARARGLNVRLGDGHALEFDQEFGAVFSNAALHWMTEPEKVIDGVYRALKPGGRFVAEFGGHGNVAAIITAMRATARRRQGDEGLAGPFFFPAPAVYREMLEKRGLKVKRIGLFPRPTPLKTGMSAWLRLFRKPFFEQYGDDAQEVLNEVESLLRPVLCDAHGNWSADYVRLRVEALKA